MISIEFEEIRLLKQSERNTVLLIRDKSTEQLFVRKVLKGRHDIYETLQNCSHPYLPKVHEVEISDDTTIVIEEHIEGQSLGVALLSEKLICKAMKELCAVLQFLHEQGIIHRDIKPSNIILATDGHIRLIDFDAVRFIKNDLEQDTRLLGTRGYAPPEQYGFAQTDERADIYSLGVTFKQLLGEKAKKIRFKRIIDKCTDLNPNKRYQSVKLVQRALEFNYSLCFAVVLAIACTLFYVFYNTQMIQQEQLPLDEPQIQEQTQIKEEQVPSEQPQTQIKEEQIPSEQPQAQIKEEQIPSEQPQAQIKEEQIPSEQTQTPAPTKTTPEPIPSPSTNEIELPKTKAKEEQRLVLTDIMLEPFNTINSEPIQLIGGEWELDINSTNKYPTLYKDSFAIARVILFEDVESDIQSKKIKTWSSPSTASEYIKVSDYLELNMSKDEVLAALEYAQQQPALPYPQMVLGKEDADSISLLFDDYTIKYYFRPDMTLVEIERYIP